MSSDKKILWVEDDPEFVSGILSTFRRNGYQISNAFDQKTALGFLRQEKDFTFVLLDIIIPFDYNSCIANSGEAEHVNFHHAAISLLEEMKKMNIDLPVIIFSVVSEGGIIKKFRDTYNRLLIIPKNIVVPDDFFDTIMSFLAECSA